VIKVQWSNSEGELSLHIRMQYMCLTVDLTALRVHCCEMGLAGCGWYRLVREHSNVNCELREKTNKMQQSDIYYQLSQHVSGIFMSIFRRTKTVCYCMWCAVLVLLEVVGSGCGALRCRVRAL